MNPNRFGIHIKGCKWLIFYSNTSSDMRTWINYLDAQSDFDKKIVTKNLFKYALTMSCLIFYQYCKTILVKIHFCSEIVKLKVARHIIWCAKRKNTLLLTTAKIKSATQPRIRFTALAFKRKMSWVKKTCWMLPQRYILAIRKSYFDWPLHLGSMLVKWKYETDGIFILCDVYSSYR